MRPPHFSKRSVLALPHFFYYYYCCMDTSRRRRVFTGPASGAVVFAAVFFGVLLLLNGRNLSATPTVHGKRHSVYEIYAVENGSFELVCAGEKIIHHAIRQVMETYGITDYSMRLLKMGDRTAISVYRNRREGYVPFFMFHRMNGNTRDPYGITPDNLNLFVDALKANKFFPIGHPSIYTADFSEVPQGFHPCSITVDDLDVGWQRFADIIEAEFGRDLDGRIPVTFSVPFYYHGRPVFTSSAEAVETITWIVENAYLANHSLEHKPLTSYRSYPGGDIDIDGFIREQVDGWYDKAEEFIGEDAYAIDTFVLPEGIGLTNEDFMYRMKGHPYVKHIVGVFDSISDPWNGPVYRYIVNNSLWKDAVARASLEKPYTAGLPDNVIEHAVFIVGNPEKFDSGALPAEMEPERLPVYIVVKKQSAGM